jgi:hypothetical protein
LKYPLVLFFERKIEIKEPPIPTALIEGYLLVLIVFENCVYISELVLINSENHGYL